MTIGIAAYGAGAGAAVAEALAMAERVGRGEIGGFAVFAALVAGRPAFFTTQRGGLGALRAAWSTAGGEAALMEAPLAAVISSGPDRPEPLTKFLVAAPAGLVTGHRLPDTPGVGGEPINRQVLRRLEAGEAPADAVKAVLSAHGEYDAGLVAATPDGIALANSRRVARRPDIGEARLVADGGDAGIAILHNSIRPVAGLAACAAEAGFGMLAGAAAPRRTIALAAGLTVAAGEADEVEIDGEGRITAIRSANPGLAGKTGWTSSAVYAGSAVLHGGCVIGRTLGEAWARIDRCTVLEVDPERSAIAMETTIREEP
ncbi:hypothetical protein HW532_17625 [Kaustia mangrovi]|uniref:Uncharacterized protein n=1 Tax=Kaustia mangrovi TaxID=2593653 RepID=A0A7S8C6L1_9HYPH|nr:hypothetical protein [Kaustia mangrovi]QPC44358.1 hypothetical protein HW532_17625 [Kaustia mangrovi]